MEDQTTGRHHTVRSAGRSPPRSESAKSAAMIVGMTRAPGVNTIFGIETVMLRACWKLWSISEMGIWRERSAFDVTRRREIPTTIQLNNTPNTSLPTALSERRIARTSQTASISHSSATSAIPEVKEAERSPIVQAVITALVAEGREAKISNAPIAHKPKLSEEIAISNVLAIVQKVG